MSSKYDIDTRLFGFTWVLKPTHERIERPFLKSHYTYGHLEYPADPYWKKIFTACMNNNQIDFIISLLSLVGQESYTDDKFSHANFLIFNKKTRKLFRYEPYGHGEHPTHGLSDVLTSLANELGFEYQQIEKSCPRIGFQKIETKTKRDYIGPGYCVLWGILFLDLLLSNPEIEPIDIQKIMYTELINNKTNFREFIQKYNTYFKEETKNGLIDLPYVLTRYGMVVNDKKQFKRNMESKCSQIGGVLKLCYKVLSKQQISAPMTKAGVIKHGFSSPKRKSLSKRSKSKRKSPKQKSRSKRSRRSRSMRKSPKRKSRSRRSRSMRKSPKRKSRSRRSRSMRKSPKRKSRSRRMKT
jgi:hypothetical protein